MRRPAWLVGGWVVLVACSVALGSLLPDRGLPGLDRPVLSDIAGHRVGWLTSLMRAVTTAGAPGFVLAYAAVAALALLLWRRDSAGCLIALLVPAGADAGETLTKSIVDRARPPQRLRVADVSAHGTSFPSGHATIAAAGLGAIGYTLARSARTAVRRAAVSAGLVAAALVAASRVYLGVHWLSDAASGWLIGAAWLALVVRVWPGLPTARARPSP